jgi:prevent-host-death family protein
MQTIGVSELRANLSGFLEQVQAGEVIVITLRGGEIARLLPPELARSEARQKLAELRSTARVGDVVSAVGEAWEAGA